MITRLNKIRRENSALQTTWNIAFGGGDNPQLLCYVKWNDDRSNRIIVVVNLDPHNTQSGWVQVPLADLRIEGDAQYMVNDVLSDRQYTWKGEWNYVELRPFEMPVHVFRVDELPVAPTVPAAHREGEVDGSWLGSEHD